MCIPRRPGYQTPAAPAAPAAGEAPVQTAAAIARERAPEDQALFREAMLRANMASGGGSGKPQNIFTSMRGLTPAQMMRGMSRPQNGQRGSTVLG